MSDSPRATVILNAVKDPCICLSLLLVLVLLTIPAPAQRAAPTTLARKPGHHML